VNPVTRPRGKPAHATRGAIVEFAHRVVEDASGGRHDGTGRGFYADAIDGTRTPANHGLEIGLRYNLNTLEQTALAAIAWLGLAGGVPHTGLAFIPAMSCSNQSWYVGRFREVVQGLRYFADDRATAASENQAPLQQQSHASKHLPRGCHRRARPGRRRRRRRLEKAFRPRFDRDQGQAGHVEA
jgi:hypothetical protein